MTNVLVRVAKAQDHGEGDVDNIVIEIGPAPIDSGGSKAERNARFVADARKIVTGLTESLPGGTLDQVLHLLLERKASQLVVRG